MGDIEEGPHRDWKQGLLGGIATMSTGTSFNLIVVFGLLSERRLPGLGQPGERIVLPLRWTVIFRYRYVN